MPWRRYLLELRWLVVAGALLLPFVGVEEALDARDDLRAAAAEGRLRTRYGGNATVARDPFVLYMHQRVLDDHAPRVVMGAALLLGLVGLGVEKGRGTATLTLALPVSRRALVASAALTSAGAVGLLTVAAVGGVVALGRIGGHPFPLHVAAGVAACMATSALLACALAFACANLLGDALRGLAAATTLTVLVYLAPLYAPPLVLVELHDLMGASEWVLHGAMPWRAMASVVLTAGALVAGTAAVLERRDF
jgi:hypothetical protein